jgi:serine protease inhibitor
MNKKKKYVLIAIPVILLIIAAILIAPGIPNFRGMSVISAGEKDLTEKFKSAGVDTKQAFSDAFIKSYTEFSIGMFKETAAAGNTENVFIAPVSTYLTLGLAASGAAGDTRAEFEKVLGNDGLSFEEISRSCAKIMSEYAGPHVSTRFRLANSIWYDMSFAPSDAFLRSNADYFGAGLYRKDFSDSETPLAINKWIEANTDNLVKGNIKEIEADTQMYLLNTFYFDAEFKSPFDPDDTQHNQIFTRSDQSTVLVDYMVKNKEDALCIDMPAGTGIILPYKDGRFAFMAVMPRNPNDDILKFVRAFDENTIAGFMNGSAKQEINVRLPKFEFESDIKLNDILKQLGLNKAFDENKADFTAMGTTPIKGNLYIGEINQKIYAKLNEEGLKITGFTFSLFTAKSMTQTIAFNRPFVYAVVDLKTNMPVFMGIMQIPITPEE